MTKMFQKKEKKELALDNQLNILRAGVLGANDGIVSVAGVVIGVAATGASNMVILIAGIAAVLAGAFSMAGGEYVSVSTQADTEKAAIAQEEDLLKSQFEVEKAEVARYYESQGISFDLASQVADEVMRKVPLETVIKLKYGLALGQYTNPWHAAISSFIAFMIGSMLPMIAIILIPGSFKIWGTILAVSLALFLTGLVSAKLGRAPTWPAIIRNVGIGLLTMVVTYIIGLLLDVSTF